MAFIYAALDGCHQVEPPHLLAATAVWEYCEASVQFIFTNKLGDPAADSILSALRERHSGMPRTEISNLFGRNLSSERIERTLDRLVRANLIERLTRTTGGRSAEVWVTKETK